VIEAISDVVDDTSNLTERTVNNGQNIAETRDQLQAIVDPD